MLTKQGLLKPTLLRNNMSYLVGGLISLVSVLSAYIYWQKRNIILENEKMKRIQDEIIKRQQENLVIFDKNIGEIISREFNDKDEISAYLSGKPTNRN